MTRLGEIDDFDPAFLDRHAPWLTRLLHAYFRARIDGLSDLPRGSFVGVGNHSGASLILDTLVWLGAYATDGRRVPMRTLAHDGLFDVYPRPLAAALAKLGAIRAGAERASRALDQGHALMVYPGGDYDACRTFQDRNRIIFAGRTGYVDLAKRAGVPLVPVVSAGAHEALFIFSNGAKIARWLGLDKSSRLKAFPVSLSLPWGIWIGTLPAYLPIPTQITVKVLPPIDPRDGTVDDVDRRVRQSMQTALDEMTADRRLWVG